MAAGNEIEPGWHVTIFDRYDPPHYQYVAMVHDGHIVPMQMSQANRWKNNDFYDLDGDPIFCRSPDCWRVLEGQVHIQIPLSVLKVFKGMRALMRTESDGIADGRHFFPNPVTKA